VRLINGKHSHFPIFNEQDIADLTEISKVQMIDFLAVPFVSHGDEINVIRKTLGVNGSQIKILAKIDSMPGVEKFDDILEEADGIIF